MLSALMSVQQKMETDWGSKKYYGIDRRWWKIDLRYHDIVLGALR